MSITSEEPEAVTVNGRRSSRPMAQVTTASKSPVFTTSRTWRVATLPTRRDPAYVRVSVLPRLRAVAAFPSPSG